MDKPEALRLAEFCDGNVLYQPAAAELRRQHGEIESLRAERLRSEHRLSEVEAQLNALLEALRALVRNEGLDAYSYLDKGIGTATAAGQRWLNARAAIKAVEEGK